ncbi:NADH:ubiquinone oxidoreductase [Phlyctochytrium bullatum]|nr:NADH:ubiquinone oxidoreductase [Phlyctochytrium bullatum]
MPLNNSVVVAFGGASIAAYEIYNARHPPKQFEWDPTKKTIAILGTGWGSTSLLKSLDTENYNVVVISPRAYFLFTPLLPSCTVGTIELRSIMQPIRFLTRFKKREVLFIEGNCINIDPEKKFVTVEVSTQNIPFDYLVVGVGAENATFGIPGVKEHGRDARRIRTHLLDCLESASFPGQPDSEVQRLLHMVVVGGGPTGVEYAAELHDFLHEDIVNWYPHIAGKLKITLIEALPHVLPMFSKELIEYTEKHFAENKVEVLNNTMVKEVKQKELIVQNANKQLEKIPYGLLVWATGNTARPLVADLIKKLPSNLQNQRRGLVTDDHLIVKGTDGSIYAVGDASATKWAPTAQVASRQGAYLADHFQRLYVLNQQRETDLTAPKTQTSMELAESLPPFSYEHLGTLAYIGSEKAIADLPGNVHVGGALTFYFWRSAYLSYLFSLRNKSLVTFDWLKCRIFGRDISRE